MTEANEEAQTDNTDPVDAPAPQEPETADAPSAATESTAPGGQTSSATEVESVSSADGLFPDLADTGPGDGGNRDMSLLMDIPVQLTVELGRKRVPIKHVLQLAQGSVIRLDAMAGEPMDVLVNGCLIAQGEVVVVNDRFGVRLTEIVTPSERIKRLNRN